MTESIDLRERIVATISEHGPLTWAEMGSHLDVPREEYVDIPAELIRDGVLEYTDDGFRLRE